MEGGNMRYLGGDTMAVTELLPQAVRLACRVS